MEGLSPVESEVINVGSIRKEGALLVGCLVTDKDWNPQHTIQVMKEAWKPWHGMSAVELGEKLVLFRFDDAIDRDWVLENQPWQFEGSLFAIKKLIGKYEALSSSAVTIDHASFWARLYDVPASCMTETSLRLFVERIGILESVDKSNDCGTNRFMRFRICMNITKPLPRGITIRVEGKYLWLPLRYECLPIYCLCCGIIGHSQSNCQNIDQKMKYDSWLRAPPLTMRRRSHPSSIPGDVLENILSRLPVKYLLRFKVVCKQWNVMISDPTFAETHLQLCTNSNSRLFAWEKRDGFEGIYVVKLVEGELRMDPRILRKLFGFQFRFESVVQYARDEYLEHDTLCCCDGLFLKWRGTHSNKVYVLFNPSQRKYKEFCCPYPIDRNRTFPCLHPKAQRERRGHECKTLNRELYGICYDPLMKDYKVVIADRKHYAVFSCRNNRWSEMKEFSFRHKSYRICSQEVSLGGSLYWILELSNAERFEIIGFDVRDEELKWLPKPDCKAAAKSYYLTSLGSHLCLFFISCDREMIMMMRREDSWMEHKFRLPTDDFVDAIPICSKDDNEIILQIRDKYYVLYNLNKNTLSNIKCGLCSEFVNPVPYLENIFLF